MLNAGHGMLGLTMVGVILKDASKPEKVNELVEMKKSFIAEGISLIWAT